MSGMEQKAGQALNNQGERCDLGSAATLEGLPAFVVAVAACLLCSHAPAHMMVSSMGNIVPGFLECFVGSVDRDAVVGLSHRLVVLLYR